MMEWFEGGEDPPEEITLLKKAVRISAIGQIEVNEGLPNQAC